MQLIHRRILGARFDGAVESLRLQRDDFGSAWRTFDRSIAHLPDVLAELAPALAADSSSTTRSETR